MADKPVQEGDYLIVNVRNTGMALDVSGANRNNGANVQIWNILNNRAQLFTIRYNDDDTVRIMAAFTGKSVDVANGQIVDGTNVQQYTNNDTRAQKWIISPTGSSIVFRNIEYPTFKIQIAANTSFVLDTTGVDATAGSNCVLHAYDGAIDQHWIFVPRPKLRSGGVYEIHSAVDPSYVVAVGSSSKANGANVMLYQTLGINDQKWVIIDEGDDKWRVRNVNSGKYFDIKGNEAVNGATIVQWGEPLNVRHQQWKIIERDTNDDHFYKGVACAFVSFGAYGLTSDGNTYMLHSYNSTAKNGVDVNLWNDEGGNGYRWLLYPVSATDPNMPIPANVALVDDLGENLTYLRHAAGTAYATWTCTKSWTSTGPNHYEWRSRRRYMSSQSSKWFEWSDYSAWETANCMQTGTQAWLADPIDGTYDINDYKNLQVEFQVRCVGVEETENLVGNEATQDFYFLWRPTYEFNLAGLSPDGLRIAYTNDYPAGMCNLKLEALVKKNAGEDIPSDEIAERNILNGEISFESLDSEGTLFIPYDKLLEPIEDGQSLELWYSGGTDQISHILRTSADIVAYEDAGHGIDATPNFTPGDGRTLSAITPVSGFVSRMWLRIGRKTVELKSQGNIFDIPYPFGVDFDVFTSVVSSNGESWGTNSTHFSATDPRLGTPCHAWHWDGGYLLLECDTEVLTTDRTFRPRYEADALDSREREIVTYAPTTNGAFVAKGVLASGQTECTRDDIHALLKAKHAFYRAPHGETGDVAITGVSYKEIDGSIQVTIDMIEETV